MEAAPKRVRGAGGGSAPDRLSALSDDLLRRVLSFLPSRFAVQTSVLSKRWIDLWRSVPAVQLDIDDFGGFDERLNRWKKMKDFASEFLMLQNTERLDLFRLVVDYSCCVRGDFERWARYGINHQPLVLQIRANEMYWKDLRISRLSSAFRRLKRLELSGVPLDQSFTDTLYSGCSVLEDLVLDNCCNEFDGIQSNTLRNLSVCTCASRVVDVLVVRAPCLASLCLGFLCYNYKNGLSLEAGNSLVRASISVVDGETSQRAQTILVGSLFNVTSLELDGFSAVAILDKELDKFPQFDNLRILSLNWCFLSERDVDKFKAIGRFLVQKSPNLEKLTLHNFWYFEGTVRKWWTLDQPRLKKVKPVVGPIEFPMLGNLRTLFLDECDLRDNFRILRHFLRSCPNLEKLTIRLCELPEASTGGNGGAKLKTTGKGAKSKKTHSGFRNLVRIQCRKLKSTEIIYKKGVKIQELVSLLLDISECAPMNTITLTKYEEAMDFDPSD